MRSIDNTPLQDTGMDCSKVSGLNSNREYSILHIKTPAESHFRYCRAGRLYFNLLRMSEIK